VTEASKFQPTFRNGTPKTPQPSQTATVASAASKSLRSEITHAGSPSYFIEYLLRVSLRPMQKPAQNHLL
jgi:hypothetical protein